MERAAWTGSMRRETRSARARGAACRAVNSQAIPAAARIRARGDGRRQLPAALLGDTPALAVANDANVLAAA